MKPLDSVSGPVDMGATIVWRDGFTPAEIDAIIAHGDALSPMKAEVTGSRTQKNTDFLRITRVAWMEKKPEILWLHERLEKMVLEINAKFFRYDLYGLLEAFQYTVYEGAEGGHYGWHVDRGETNYEPRKISLSLQLSDGADYEGGELLVEAGDGPRPSEKARGSLIAFPSFVLHRVMPVTSGTRKSLVVWVAGPEFR
jgi:PKHD-type hydroxylase